MATRRNASAARGAPPSGAPAAPADAELKARHRTMWASVDYPSMIETFLLPLGPRLVEACGIGDGMTVLDIGEAFNRVFEDWNRGAPDEARFEMEYLLSVGTRR